MELEFLGHAGEEIEEELEVDVADIDLSKVKFDGAREWINTAPLRLIRSVEELHEVFSNIPDGAEVAHDIETTSLNIEKAKIVGISFAFSDPVEGDIAYYIPVGHKKGSDLNLPIKEVLDLIVELSSRVCFLFYHKKYDLGVYKYYNIFFPKTEDVQGSVYLYDTGWKGIGLKDSSKRFLGQEMIEIKELFFEIERKRLDELHEKETIDYNNRVATYELAKKNHVLHNGPKPVKKDFNIGRKPKAKVIKKNSINIDFEMLSPEGAYLYAASDALQTLKLHKHLYFVRMPESDFIDSGLNEKAGGQVGIYKLENMFSDVLLDMECNKVRVDVDYVKRLLPQLVDNLYSAMDSIYEDLNIPKDFGSKSDFFYRVVGDSRKVFVSLDEPFRTDLLESSGNINNFKVHINFKNLNILNELTIVGTYHDGTGFPVDVKFHLSDNIKPGDTGFSAVMEYHKTEFFIDSATKIGSLLFTPSDRYIDFYTGSPIETYTAIVKEGYGDREHDKEVVIKGLKEKLDNKFDRNKIYQIKGLGIKGGRVTQKNVQWSTSDDDLKGMGKDYPIISSILDYRKKKKAINTYVLPFLTLKPYDDGNYYAKFAFRGMAVNTGRVAAGDGGGGADTDTGYLKVNAQAITSNDGSIWLDARKIISGVEHI